MRRAEQLKNTAFDGLASDADLQRATNAEGRAARAAGRIREAPYAPPTSALVAWWYEGYDQAPAPLEPPQETIAQARRRIAQSYQQASYVVYADGLPPVAHVDFLRPFQPALVAEGLNDEGALDRVVIEVRTTRSLRDDMAFLTLVEAVTAQPGWRLELVAIPEPKAD